IFVGGGELAVHVRIPAWCKAPVLSVNGRREEDIVPGEYAVVRRVWKSGDSIVLELPTELRWVRHEHYMKTSDRKPYKTSADADAPYALVRGPVVYAFDDIWYKGDTADFSRARMDSVRYVLKDVKGFRMVAAPEGILGPGYEVPVQLADGRLVELPVYPFANIGKWYRDAAHKPDSNAAAWSYAIWLKGVEPRGCSMPKVFSSNMVLQRGGPVPVWGLGMPGSMVTVRFGGQMRSVKVGARGDWRVDLGAMEASPEGRELRVTDDAGGSIVFKNVLVGEVWLCGGQSNMEYTMRKNSKFSKDTAEEGNPSIRIFLVKTSYSKRGTVAEWDSAVGKSLRDFSAPGYFFAKELYGRLHVPIGVIANAVPGSAIEPFLPEEEGDTARSRGKFFSTMVKPLAPYALRGFCWYQGETNCFMSDTVKYTEKMKMLIGSWRGLWERPEASFYFVQIAPFRYSHDTHNVYTEPAFWAAQERALVVPRTGMVVTTDLVDSIADLHPAYKWEIGRRLALWALAKDYGQSLVCSGPVYRDMVVKGRKVELLFGEVGSGLVSHDGKEPDWFEVAGADGKFVMAKARIEGPDKVVLEAAGVRSPVSVRFGWNESAQPNLFNKEGLPAMPFRTKK
ncbi:MAG TPA: sialate O-acetylesterase, partial [Puia sp.]